MCLIFQTWKKKKKNQEIVWLEAFKACQDTDVPTKNIKENAYLETLFILQLMPLSIMVIFHHF